MNGYHDLLSSASFLRSLLDLDWRVATRVREKGCGCGGPLHWALYPRAPRGVPDELAERFSKRLSLCCGALDCRRRTTPPSVCFLGRRVYTSVAFVLVWTLTHGVTPQRARELRALLPADDRTLTRWREWWCRTLPSTSFWRVAEGRLARPISPKDLPVGLLERFAGDAASRVTALLIFLSELSTSSCRSWSDTTMAS